MATVQKYDHQDALDAVALAHLRKDGNAEQLKDWDAKDQRKIRGGWITNGIGVVLSANPLADLAYVCHGYLTLRHAFTRSTLLSSLLNSCNLFSGHPRP